MPPIRNRYVLTISTLALLLGSALLWFTQSSEPVASSIRIDAVSGSGTAVAIGETASEVTNTPSSTSGSDDNSASQPAIEQSSDTATNTPQATEPVDTASAIASRNTSNVAAPSQTDPATPRLSGQVFEVVSEVQRLQLAGQWEESLNEMNALWGDIEQLNPFEQATLLNFYTNTLARLEMWQESITAFNLILQVPNLRPDTSARALLALGQLHAREGERPESVAYLQEWLNFTNAMEGMDALTPRVSTMLACLQGNAEAAAGCTL